MEARIAVEYMVTPLIKYANNLTDTVIDGHMVPFTQAPLNNLAFGNLEGETDAIMPGLRDLYVYVEVQVSRETEK